jgi:outer membrane protein assembly factor BamA
VRIEPAVSRYLSSWGSLKIGPAFQRIEMEDPETDKDRFIEDYATTLDYNIFDEYNMFGGGAWEFIVDKRNNKTFTHRGILLNASGRSMKGFNSQTNTFSSYEGSFAIYHSFRSNARLTFALRAGAGVTSGTHQFYQAQILDGKTELRGFRKTRFYGDKKFYSNFEIRLKLLRFRSYLFPASLGVLGFHDVGRVWYKNAAGIDPSAGGGSSSVWHKGWGGGLWFTPFNLTVLSVEAAHSDDGMMGYVRLGFMF